MRISDWSSDVCSSDLLYPAELRAPKEIFNWPPAILSQPVRVNEKTGDIRLGSLHEMRQRVLNSILDFRRNEGKGQRRYFNAFRSEEHTSELQSLMRISYAVFGLKKKNHYPQTANI